MFCNAKKADSALENKAEKPKELNIRIMYQYGTPKRGPLNLLTNHPFHLTFLGDQTILQPNYCSRLISLLSMRESPARSIEAKATPEEKPLRISLLYNFRLK